MNPAAAKLLMCLSAGVGGAVTVPAVNKVASIVKPRPAVVRVASTPIPKKLAVAKPMAVSAREPSEVSSPLESSPCIPVTLAAPLIAQTQYVDPDSLRDLTGFARSLPGDVDDGTGPSQLLGFGSRSNGGVAVGLASATVAPPGGGDGEPEVPGGTGPVPEPASWAMMISGFGLLGGAMRWRRVAAQQEKAVAAS